MYVYTYIYIRLVLPDANSVNDNKTARFCLWSRRTNDCPTITVQRWHHGNSLQAAKSKQQHSDALPMPRTKPTNTTKARALGARAAVARPRAMGKVQGLQRSGTWPRGTSIIKLCTTFTPWTRAQQKAPGAKALGGMARGLDHPPLLDPRTLHGSAKSKDVALCTTTRPVSGVVFVVNPNLYQKASRTRKPSRLSSRRKALWHLRRHNQRGKGYTKERAVATAVEGASAESDALTLTKAEKKKARAELLTQTIIDMANTDPTVYLADKLANCGETKCDMAKSSTLQSDLDKMILSGTFTENVIDAQRKEIIEAKQRETKAAKHAMTNWKLPQQANQRLLRLQADIEGKHTKAVEEHKKLEDDTTAAIKALREKLDQANVAKDLEDKVYTEKIDKVKCALDLLPAAYGKQKLIEEQMQDDQDMDELELLEESDQEVDQPSQDPISASKVKFILDEALKQANLQATGNAELQQGLAALFGGIGNALIAATSGGSNPKIASKKMIKKTKAAKVPVVPVDSDSDFDSDVDIPAAARKRHRENPESEEDIYPWDDEGETATMRIEQEAA